MATTLTITDGTGTDLTATGTSTTLTINTALSAAVASDIVYTPSGKMSSTNMQTAIDELAGDDFRSTGTPSGSQVDNGDLWYDTDDHEPVSYTHLTLPTICSV